MIEGVADFKANGEAKVKVKGKRQRAEDGRARIAGKKVGRMMKDDSGKSLYIYLNRVAR